MAELWRDVGFGVYIHWPFCQAKCPYCDFNSHVATHVDQTVWQDAFLREIDRVADLTGPRTVTSVFFGGGTPSLMEPRVVGAILDRVSLHWGMSESVEVTLEANPTSVEAGRLRDYAAAGVTRGSLGVQALNDRDLKRLGRLHSVVDGLRAYDAARRAFGQVSFDLIYARQDQSLEQWTAELERALATGPEHLSLYQLTIEDGTAFGRRYQSGRLFGLPDEDLAADLYDATQEITAAAGLPAYEVSNHARDGHASQHNLTYWESGDYAGIGPGAHGRLTFNGLRHETVAPSPPKDWLADAGSSKGFSSTPMMCVDVLSEFFLMGLRVVKGVSLKRAARLSGFSEVMNKIKDLENRQLASIENGYLRLTPQARPLLNAVLSDLLA